MAAFLVNLIWWFNILLVYLYRTLKLDVMLEELFQISEGNPGALTCVTGLVNGTIEDSVAGITIIPTIKKTQIYGTDLYVLWSDLSQRNYQLMAHLCKEVPSDLLKLASSKQDYSGIEMVKEYIESFQKSLVVKK